LAHVTQEHGHLSCVLAALDFLGKNASCPRKGAHASLLGQSPEDTYLLAIVGTVVAVLILTLITGAVFAAKREDR
jgi:hypothetical protein